MTTQHNTHKNYLLVLLMLLSMSVSPVFSQCNDNQVPACGELIMNNSFEYTSFPFVPNDFAHCFSELIFSCHWNDGSIDYGQGGTPDIFHVDFSPSSAPFCATNPCSIPNSFAGTQAAIVGSPFGNPQTSYAGIHTMHRRTSSPTQFREYIVQHLATPILPGQSVNVSLQVSLAELSSRHSTISVAFLSGSTSPGIISQTSTWMDIASAYKITFSPTSNKTIWQPLSGTWVNTTGNTITDIIIGNFDTDAAIFSYSPTPFSHQSWTGLPDEASNPTAELAYYFVDDVSVQIAEPCCSGADATFINIDNGGLDPDGDNILMSSIYSTLSPVGITDIFIQGELIIDGSTYSLNGKNVTFAAGSKVTIQSGQFWNINNSHLHGCDQMWQGIFADQPSTSVNISGSIIEDAINGVYVKNNSNVTAVNSNFRNNYIGIKYENYTSPSPNLIRNTTFQTTLANSLPPGGSNLGYLLPPHNGIYGKTGIEVYNCPSVVLRPSGSFNRNYFQYLQNGIISYSSGLEVSNANFNQIKNYHSYTPILQHGVAILSYNQVPAIKTVKVSNPTGVVNITNCDNGIFTDGNHHNTFTNNTISTIRYRAINQQWNNPITVAPAFQITVTGNTITNAYEGIYNYNCGKTRCTTYVNTIINTVHNSGSRGIVVEQSSIGSSALCSTTGSGLPVQIRSNTITRYSRGIHTVNATCINVYENNVYLQSPSGGQHHGIWFENSPHNIITNNNVYGNFQDWRCIGIRIFKSPGVHVGCNYIEKTEIAFFLDNDCSNSKFAVNTLSKYNKGFTLLGSANIGSQSLVGPTKYNLRNRFDKAPGNSSIFEFVADQSIVGTNSIFYFIPEIGFTPTDIDTIHGALLNGMGAVINTSFTNPSYPFNGFSPAINFYLNLNNTATDTKGLDYNGCVGGADIEGFSESGDMGDGVAQRFTNEDILNTEFANGYEYEDEHRWMFSHNVLRDYKSIQPIADLSEFPDEVIELTTQINSSDVGMLDEVENLIGVGDYDAAFVLNQLVTPNGNYPTKLKEINSILIPQWQQIINNYQYTLTDESIIQSILNVANLCLTEYGDAVLKARVFAHNHIDPMIEFVDPCEVIYGMEERSLSLSDVKENEHGYLLYPNPTADKFIIYANKNTEVKYRIIDLQGRVVLNGSFINVVNINTSEWNNGTYFIHLLDVDGTTTLKLVVNH